MAGYSMFIDERTLFYKAINYPEIYKFNATRINFSVVFLVYVYLHTQNKYLLYLEILCVKIIKWNLLGKSMICE